MSKLDYTPFVKPDEIPRIPKPAAMSFRFDAYPPMLEPLLGMWGPLSKEPFKGVTSDGKLAEGCFVKQEDNSPVAGAAEAATAWLDSLPSDLRAKVQFEIDSDLWRHWHNVPLCLRDNQIELVTLNDKQRQLALEIIKASLSEEGYYRTREVMKNNALLGELNDLKELLNEWCFTISVFGQPSSIAPWGWQIFGHHLSLNCIFIDGQMVLSPIFMGVEPDTVSSEKERRLFQPHEESALDMFAHLTDRQKKDAVLYDTMITAEQPEGRYHPDDGRQVGGAFQDNRIVPYEGVGVAALDKAQRLKLLGLAEQFVSNLPSGPAQARMNEIERYLDKTYFAWIGKANDIDPFYFRIHSPVAMIEFDHHSGIFLANQEPERFHVHTIVRTPNGGDYGKDLLRQHYAQGGHNHDSDGAHSHDGGKTFHKHD